MDQMCILLVWSGSKLNSGFTFKSRQGRYMERSPSSCHASRQWTLYPNSTTKPRVAWKWPSPHQLGHKFCFKASFMEPFISWKTPMLFSWKLKDPCYQVSQACLSGFTFKSPALRVMWKPSTKTTHEASDLPMAEKAWKLASRELGIGIQTLHPPWVILNIYIFV